MKITLLGSALGFILLRPGLACTVCYGNSQAPVLKGAEAAVWVMLGLTGLILSAFGIFIFQLRKRSLEGESLSTQHGH